MNPKYPASQLPVNLVCPRCRTPDRHGNLNVVFLEIEDTAKNPAERDCSFDRCPNCGTAYPRVEGIYCVPPDLEAFGQAQAGTLDPNWVGCRSTREDAIRTCAWNASLDPASDAFREAFLPALYALAHFPEPIESDPLRSELTCNRAILDLLRAWLGDHNPPIGRAADCVLDVGCGPGRLLHELAPILPKGALGLDLRLSMLRVAQRLVRNGAVHLAFRAEGRRFEPIRIVTGHEPNQGAPIRLVQGDIISPPFEAEIFPLVCAISLLDTVLDPIFALGQLDALVCPDGLLVLGTPYHWEPGVTSPDGWLSGADSSGADIIRTALQGRHPVLPHLNYELLEETPALPWALPSHRRLVHRFFLDVVLARKRA